jgi:hypothetical protein
MPIRLATPEEMQETRDCREEMQAWENIGMPLTERDKKSFYRRWGLEVQTYNAGYSSNHPAGGTSAGLPG